MLCTDPDTAPRQLGHNKAKINSPINLQFRVGSIRSDLARTCSECSQMGVGQASSLYYSCYPVRAQALPNRAVAASSVLGGSCALDPTDERIPGKMDATQEAQSSANEGLESMQVEQVGPPEWRSVLNFNHDLGGL